MVAQMHGILTIDKQVGMSSHGVVAHLRRLLGTRHIGHAGTLDPLATGLLVVLVGDATRSCASAMAGEKRYDATVRFGFSTTTDDREGSPLDWGHAPAVDLSALLPVLEKFLGEQVQIPPRFCAKKIGGVPCYRSGRSGRTVSIAGRPVQIFQIFNLLWNAPLLKFSLACSPGTYVRSLARDIGSAVGCPAHLHRLRRTHSGCFFVGLARTLPELAKLNGMAMVDEMAKNWQLLDQAQALLSH